MNPQSVLKLYHHFIVTADVSKYHGNLTVLRSFMKMPESEIRAAIRILEDDYRVNIFWFSDQDFIADVTGKELHN
jgi:hypothetical protein